MRNIGAAVNQVLLESDVAKILPDTEYIPTSEQNGTERSTTHREIYWPPIGHTSTYIDIYIYMYIYIYIYILHIYI